MKKKVKRMESKKKALKTLSLSRRAKVIKLKMKRMMMKITNL